MEIMAKKKLLEMIEVMQAALAGQEIQTRMREAWGNPLGGSWNNLDMKKAPVWQWGTQDYRVRPTPREVFVNIHQDGSMNAFPTKQRALDAVFNDTPVMGVKFREVLKD